MGAKQSKKCSHNYACGHTKTVTVAPRYASNSRTNVTNQEFSGIIDGGNHNDTIGIQPDITKGGFHEQIRISDGSIGNGYESLLGKYLDKSITAVRIEDAFIQKHHQLQLFLRMCELLIRSCPDLDTIHLKTVPAKEGKDRDSQELSIAQLKDQLRKRGISLNVAYSTTLHDREIRLSNGLIIKIGRGLDYLKPPENKYSPGYFDLDLRQCYETTVDVFHKSNVKTTVG